MPLAFLTSLRPQRQPTRFTGEIWVNFLSGARSAHPTSACSCCRTHAICLPEFFARKERDHVLTCKKHTGAITGHDHVMTVTVQLARNSGLRVRINRKVATIAADSNKKDDVQAMELSFQDTTTWFGMCLSSVIGSAAARSMVSMVSCNSATTLTRGLAARLANSDVIVLPRTSLSHLQSYLSLARFILNFYASGWCWLTCRPSSTLMSLGMKRTLGMNVSSGVGLAHAAIIGMRLALPLHTLQPYALICRYIAPLTP